MLLTMDRVSYMQTSHLAQNRQYSLTDLIPLEKLQKIQDAFAIANQVASTITDPDGVPITRASNYCAVCTMIRATETGLQKCIASGKRLGDMAHTQQHPVHRECSSIGFTDAAAPIIVQGKHIANWLIGQYHTHEVDEQRIIEYAEEIGADPQKMKYEFRAMPKLSREAFESKLGFLEILAHELSMMGYLHLQQREQTAELNQIKAELEEQQTQLEQNVLERTKELQQTNAQLELEISMKSKIQKRQNRLITAIESAAESIVITSSRGRIIYVNPAFEKLTGYSRQEVLGATPRILQSGYHDKKFYNNLWQTIRKGEIWSGRFVNKKKDGSLYQEESTVSPVVDNTGKILSYVAVKKDVTKEQQLQAQLKQAQRLETIGTLAAGMAHEINTPVQYVLANTHFLQDALKDLAQMQELYKQLVDSASPALSPQIEEITRRARDIDIDYLIEESETAIKQSIDGLNKVASIVKAMKEFADPGNNATRQVVNINALVRSTVDVSRKVWDKVADVELFLDDAIPEVPLYAGKIKQVLLDMLINSTHALIEKYGMPPDGKGQITISTGLCGNEVELRIGDTGAGMPEGVVSRIFDPFFTTKTVGQGEGQSLAIAYRVIVEEHGGSVTVESRPQAGTTFTIRFPTQSIT